MSVYYEDEAVTLHHGDWRDLIDPDLQADCIVTDPPYGETSLKWDKWPAGWPALAARHSRSMWCFGSMRMFLDQRDEFTAWRLSQDIVWEKHNGSGPGLRDRFYRVHEHALHFYRGAWVDVHHIAPRVERSGPNRTWRTTGADQAERSAHRGEIGPRTGYVDDGTRLARSVIRTPNMHQQGTINETQKPVSVVENLVAYACPPGGLVLDLFAGSSSTLVAASITGRRAIGFEMREDQCEKAALRLSQGSLNFGETA